MKVSERPVHFWEMTDPRPVYLCGRQPNQGRDRPVPVMRVTPATLAWFAKHIDACRNCLRVARARVAGSRSPEGTEGER